MVNTFFVFVVFAVFINVYNVPIIKGFEMDESDEDFSKQFALIYNLQQLPNEVVIAKSNSDLAKHPFSNKELPDYDEGVLRTTSSKPSPENDEEVCREIGLGKINAYREKHFANELTLQVPLNDQADEIAKGLLENANFVPQINGGNIAMSSYIETKSASSITASTPPPEKIVEDAITCWYNEFYDYNFANPKPNKFSRNFTNMVWKSTTDLGIGIARNSDCSVVVALYQPESGNTVDDFKTNVQPKAEEQRDFSDFFGKHFSSLKTLYF